MLSLRFNIITRQSFTQNHCIALHKNLSTSRCDKPTQKNENKQRGCPFETASLFIE